MPAWTQLLFAACLASACGARSDLEVGDGGRAPRRMDAGMDAALDAALDAGMDAFVPDAGDAGVPYVPPTMGCREVRMGVRPPTEVPLVDVLFVIDNSRSMREEQDALTAGFPVFARALVTGDIDGDGVIDFPPITDLHVGVISTDMGRLREDRGEIVPFACLGTSSPRGDDGLLQSANEDLPECAGMGTDYYLSFESGESVDAFAEAFSCVARLGIDGCGFEQPLEASLKALTPSTSSIAFTGAAVGHGDSLNAGFLREGSVLAIVIVSDEDDGSFANASYLEPRTPEEAALGDGWLHPVERYITGLPAMRGDASRFVLALIAGIPVDLASRAGEPLDAAGILADPRMQLVFDPDEGVRRRPACVSDHGRASPARRLVEVAGSMPDRAVVQSICQDDFRPAITVIAAQLGEVVVRTWCVDGDDP